MIRERTLEKDVRADTRVALTRDSGDFSGGSSGTKSSNRAPNRRFPSAGPVPGRVGLDKCPDTNGGSDASQGCRSRATRYHAMSHNVPRGPLRGTKSRISLYWRADESTVSPFSRDLSEDYATDLLPRQQKRDRFCDSCPLYVSESSLHNFLYFTRKFCQLKKILTLKKLHV